MAYPRYPSTDVFDVADAAVEAAIAAAARYTDARLMDRRTESMAAPNGEVETLTRTGRLTSACGRSSAPAGLRFNRGPHARCSTPRRMLRQRRSPGRRRCQPVPH